MFSGNDSDDGVLANYLLKGIGVIMVGCLLHLLLIGSIIGFFYYLYLESGNLL